MHAPDGALQFPGRIGLGTWEMGADPGQRPQEIAAVKHALDVGYRLLDTAEMYADGGAERIIGSALQSFGAARRAELCIVSKVLPGNASRSGTARACEASIERMGCDYLDLYLLHWPGRHPLAETLRGFPRPGAARIDPPLWRQQLRCRAAATLAAGAGAAGACAASRAMQPAVLLYRRAWHRVSAVAIAACARHCDHGVFTAGTRLTDASSAAGTDSVASAG